MSNILSPILPSYRRKVRAWKTGVVHATLDPRGPGVARLHLVPPKPSLFSDPPFFLHINGWHIIPIGRSWGILLQAFLETLNQKYPVGQEIGDDALETLLNEVVAKVQHLYPRVSKERLLSDLDEIVTVAIVVACGKDVPKIATVLSPRDLAPYMTGPFRMDLVVAPMVKAGVWDCPLHCKNCYAAGQAAMSITDELSTEKWKAVIDRCREIGIPRLTFTGGEPLMRKDIAELVAHAEWHVTTLNTSGVLLSWVLARKLYQANLDSIQITFYSHSPAVHDYLVGSPGAWQKTLDGIGNALAAGLNVSVNTPLSRRNRDYANTLRFLAKQGIRFVTCSGLILTGAAPSQAKRGETLVNGEMMEVLTEAVATAKELGMELSFTSPGWLSKEQLASLGLQQPVCGACLSNMAVMPNGAVTACQSWLSDPKGFGNILATPWGRIWNNPTVRKIRKNSAFKDECPLKEV